MDLFKKSTKRSSGHTSLEPSSSRRKSGSSTEVEESYPHNFSDESEYSDESDYSDIEVFDDGEEDAIEHVLDVLEHPDIKILPIPENPVSYPATEGEDWIEVPPANLDDFYYQDEPLMPSVDEQSESDIFFLFMNSKIFEKYIFLE